MDTLDEAMTELECAVADLGKTFSEMLASLEAEPPQHSWRFRDPDFTQSFAA